MFKFALTFTSKFVLEANVSLGGHNLGTFYARQLKFGMLLT